jgi:hypothetical protein
MSALAATFKLSHYQYAVLNAVQLQHRASSRHAATSHVVRVQLTAICHGGCAADTFMHHPGHMQYQTTQLVSATTENLHIASASAKQIVLAIAQLHSATRVPAICMLALATDSTKFQHGASLTAPLKARLRPHTNRACSQACRVARLESKGIQCMFSQHRPQPVMTCHNGMMA